MFDFFKTMTLGVAKISEFLNFIEDLLPIHPEVVEQMSYREAISYFIKERPSDSDVVKGAMLLQNHSQGHIFVQVFLNARNELVCDSEGKPYGRRLVTRSLDAELKETFGNKKLVVVE